MRSSKRKIISARRRNGTSLLEVMVASVCASLFLLPTATMLVDASRWVNRMENQSELLGLADSCLDDLQYQLASSFRSGNVTGDFASQGFRQIRFQATLSDSAVDQGIPGRFMVIHVFLWHDANSSGSWDAGEPRHELRTGIARRG